MSEPTSPAASARPDFPKIEEEMSAFWEKKHIFERSLEERPETKVFTFYDGPPFASGLPHYGHLLQSAIKDAVPRYWTMKGYRVPRRWGWDCHGLPVENLIEKELGLKAKRDIEAMGIEKFNDACRTSVRTYVDEWGKYVNRIGRWVDFDHAYQTMDNSYIESVWWVFAEIHRKGFVYKDRRVSFFCPRCSTPLSNFEIAMDNSYVDAEDPAVTVRFKVKGADDTYLLAWTTTPWTLPANVAIAANPALDYVKVKITETGETLIFAESRMSDVLKTFYPLPASGEVPFEVTERLNGADLAGMEYEPLFAFMTPDKPAYRVVTMDYVTADDGTGLVHTAPAFGEDDLKAARAHDLTVLLTVDDEGRQMAEMGPFAGLPIKESDPLVVADLKARGLLFREERVTHSVPVCWRCATHLLYKAQPAWYVDVTKVKGKMLDTAKKVDWYPEHFKEGRFGKGIETAPDWCISRTRFWGAPMPVWECADCGGRKVIASVKEMRENAVGKVPESLDLHRPSIDEVTLRCACGKEMRRIPEVFDCWFESGSMPYASEHYPFENKTWFDEHFPADFIAEGQDQTRGWFYSLHVLAAALFGKPAFRNVIVTGMIQAEDGKKMSKRLKNYPDPWELMTRVGADSLRYYLLSSPVIRAEQLNFSEKDCEAVQRALLGILWNVRAFYLTYAGDETVEVTKPRSSHVLDRWIFSRLMSLEKDVTEAMDRYDLVDAVRPLRPFVDDLSTWWLRRSRERMKGNDAYERTDALRTLREVLLETAIVMAPFMPFFAEKLYQDLEGAKMSVHLERWPKPDERLVDETLMRDMDWVREVVTSGLDLRASAKVPVRQALASLSVHFRDSAEAERLKNRIELLHLVRDELNVEKVLLENGAESLQEADAWIATLDTVITPELKRKGLSREVVRHLKNLRKTAGLQPNDRIVAAAATDDAALRETLESVKAPVAADIRADVLDISTALPDGLASTADIELDGVKVLIGLRKA